MDELLAQLNAVPGVVGSLVCDADGRLLAHAFPSTIDVSQVQRAASVLATRGPGLEAALGAAALSDFRYAGARVVVKGIDGARLLFLCAPSINLPFLTMSASGVVQKLERLVRERPGAGSAAGALYQAVQRVDELIVRAGGDRFKLRGQVALKAGFALDLVDPETPDDPEKLQKLKAAASAVLGKSI
jgi:predicted regulator of Ras-like GTPase activity (Roadblock/LC7/MglB family)